MDEAKEPTAIEKLLEEISREAEARLARNQFQMHPEKAWWNRTRDKHILQLMSALRVAAVHVRDDKEYRKGLIGAAAEITIALRHHDEQVVAMNDDVRS